MTDKVARAGNVVNMLNDALREGGMGLRTVPPLIKTVLDEELWRERKLNNGKVAKHERFIDFICSPPLEGLGEQPETIKRLLRDDVETLAAFESAVIIGNQGRRTDIVNNINDVESEKGTSKAYTVRRLAKDHPELFQKVKSGELSANQAAIQAGFRKVPMPIEIAKRAVRKMTPDEIAEFATWFKDNV